MNIDFNIQFFCFHFILSVFNYCHLNKKLNFDCTSSELLKPKIHTKVHSVFFCFKTTHKMK